GQLVEGGPKRGDRAARQHKARVLPRLRRSATPHEPAARARVVPPRPRSGGREAPQAGREGRSGPGPPREPRVAGARLARGCRAARDIAETHFDARRVLETALNAALSTQPAALQRAGA